MGFCLVAAPTFAPLRRRQRWTPSAWSLHASWFCARERSWRVRSPPTRPSCGTGARRSSTTSNPRGPCDRDRRRRPAIRGSPRDRGRAEELHRLPQVAAPQRQADPGPLERRGRLGSSRRPRPRPRLREPHEPPGAGTPAALPGRRQRDRDPVSLWLDHVREQGRPAGWKSFRHDLRRQRAAEGARRARAVEGCPGDYLHRIVVTLPRIVIERCHYLAECTEEPGAITRPFASDAMRCAHVLVGDWMREAGMTVRRDNIGNLRGRYVGMRDSTLLLGSHLDSVRDAGKYDGPLGVIVAIAAVQRLHDSGKRLPFAIEVLAFADEEGLRFGSTYLGSRAVAGTLDLADLDRVDADGVPMRDAIRAFGGDPERIDDDKWSGERPLGYCEVHIEQGPVLESRDLAVGVVSAIAGQERHRITFTGEAAHAGTTPMDKRRDALVAASVFVQAVEGYARNNHGMVATVGQLS